MTKFNKKNLIKIIESVAQNTNISQVPGISPLSKNRLTIEEYSPIFLEKLVSFISQNFAETALVQQELYARNNIFIDTTSVERVNEISSALQEKGLEVVRGGPLKTNVSKVIPLKGGKQSTLFERITKKLQNGLAVIQGFVQQHPRFCLVSVVVILLILLGRKFLPVGIPTSEDVSTPQEKSSAHNNEDNTREEVSSTSKELTLTNDSSSIKITEHPSFVNKSVPCSTMRDELTNWYLSHKQKNDLPRLVKRAIRRLEDLGMETSFERLLDNPWALISPKEIEVLFTETDFLTLPGVVTLLAREEECVS